MNYAEAVVAACEIERPKHRRPWSEVPELDDSDDPHPELAGTHCLEAAVESGRCGFPLKSVYEETGQIRWCTRLPDRRFGLGRWEQGSIFCRHHKEHEPEPAKDLGETIGEWSFQVFVNGATPREVEAALSREADA